MLLSSLSLSLSLSPSLSNKRWSSDIRRVFMMHILTIPPHTHNSINRFVIGTNVTDWPVHSANENETELAVLNTDTYDPPCIDLYTSAATPVGDGYVFFPMMSVDPIPTINAVFMCQSSPIACIS